MREIAERLHEKKQIELAKSILESKGYKIEKAKESSDTPTLWMGEYTPVPRTGRRSEFHVGKKKVVFYCDGDIRDAEEEIGDILPPYSSCRVLGKAPSLQACLDDGFELLNEPYTESIEENSSVNFKVGDVVEWSGLYGGSYTGKVKDITDEKITLTVSWTSEDDGKLVQKDSTYDLEKDEEGNDVFVVWEYHGHKGYVYPPSMDESKKLTEDAFDYDEESEGDQSLFDIISTQLVDTMFPDTQFDMKEMEKIDKAVHLLIWVRKHLESRDAI